MVKLLMGNGRFDFRIHTGRIEYETISPYYDEIPEEGLDDHCLAVVVLDDRHVMDFGNGVATAIMFKGGHHVPSGWLHWKQAREYRKQMADAGVEPAEAVVCLGRLRGGNLHNFRKGPKRMALNLFLDLDWPLRFSDDWHPSCAQFLR